jgi:hypothetical protein
MVGFNPKVTLLIDKVMLSDQFNYLSRFLLDRHRNDANKD